MGSQKRSKEVKKLRKSAKAAICWSQMFNAMDAQKVVKNNGISKL